MKGYNTLKECVNDYVLLLAARQMSIPYLKKGENIVSYLEKSIRLKKINASQNFKRATKGYTNEDFQLMALDNTFTDIDDLQEFLTVWNQHRSRTAKVKKILSSSAFKMGNLKTIGSYLPQKIRSNNDLIEFICNNDNVKTSHIKAISEYYGIKDWRSVLRKAEEEKLIRKHGSCWGP